jgi:prepilin-type N-terminal cleavage/methylation domain-containing protein
MRERGFTLVEVVIGVFVFALVAMAVYQAYTAMYATIAASRVKIDAADLANEEFEIIKNLPFADVGVEGSVPSGKLTHVQTLVRNRTSFVVTTTVRNIDDPFDGTIGGTPNDLSPADYKLVEVDVDCPTCKNFTSVHVAGRVAPKNLETASTNGALFIQVFDANGQPISGANVHIFNNTTPSSVTIDDVTNASGMLQIVDAPPATSSYQVTVSKSGYSTDKTYPLGAVGNPDPTKPHATVTLQNVTQVSFAIDRLSTLNVSSVDKSCAVVPNFPFTLQGAKLIGTPFVYKYNKNLSTDAGGQLSVPNLEWDSYSVSTNSGTYEIDGLNPLPPFGLLPNSTQSLQFVLGPKSPNTVLVAVTDASTGLPLSGAEVTLGMYASYTGQGSVTQTDWSGGSGQATSSDPTKYDSSTNIAVTSPIGDATLTKTFGTYASDGTLTSSAFDFGTSSTLKEIIWNPTSEPAAVGPDSVKFQVATNNDGSTWNFVGPDGTAATFYTTADRDLSTQHSNVRYGKYKLYLSTASTTFTPNLSDASITFLSGCIPPGQVSFSGLSDGTYDIAVSKSGYAPYSGSVTATSSWQLYSVPLTPQ